MIGVGGFTDAETPIVREIGQGIQGFSDELVDFGTETFNEETQKLFADKDKTGKNNLMTQLVGDLSMTVTSLPIPFIPKGTNGAYDEATAREVHDRKQLLYLEERHKHGHHLSVLDIATSIGTAALALGAVSPVGLIVSVPLGRIALPMLGNNIAETLDSGILEQFTTATVIEDHTNERPVYVKMQLPDGSTFNVYNQDELNMLVGMSRAEELAYLREQTLPGTTLSERLEENSAPSVKRERRVSTPDDLDIVKAMEVQFRGPDGTYTDAPKDVLHIYAEKFAGQQSRTHKDKLEEFRSYESAADNVMPGEKRLFPPQYHVMQKELLAMISEDVKAKESVTE